MIRILPRKSGGGSLINWRLVRQLALTAFLLWFGFYELAAYRRHEESLIGFYVVLAALAIPAIFEHFWERGREEERARKGKKD